MLVEDRSAPSPPGDEPAALEEITGPSRAQVVAAAVATGLLGGLAFPPFDASPFVGWPFGRESVMPLPPAR